MPQSWTATCLQTQPISISHTTTPEEARAAIRAGLKPLCRQIAETAAAEGSDLVLLPEKTLGDREVDLRGCIDFPGPEIEMVQKTAQASKVFIAANAYTLNPDFPGRYFNTSFVVDRSGEIVLKSYRLHTYHSTSPHDFWKRFLDKVGLEGAFPVAKTELGGLAMVASMEMMYPEIARLLVLRGAETVMHTTLERIVDISTKRTRAAENICYVMSANGQSLTGFDDFMDTGSAIVHWDSHVLAKCEQGKPGACSATIDLESLRKRRSVLDFEFPSGNVNYLSRIRTEIAATGYGALSIYPGETYADGEVTDAAIDPAGANRTKLNEALGAMVKAGMLPREYADA
jgi:predicted amidohydrolase